MNLDDVREGLLHRPRPLAQVKVGDDDGLPPKLDNTSVLLRRADGSWFTGFFERGRYHGVREFADEDCACRDFWAMMNLDPDRRRDPPDAGGHRTVPSEESGA